MITAEGGKMLQWKVYIGAFIIAVVEAAKYLILRWMVR